MTAPSAPETRSETSAPHVTATIAGQLFAIPVARVQDVFALGRLTPVPLAGPDVVGLMTLRGRVVTAIDLGPRLGRPAREPAIGSMAIAVEAGPDCFGVLVDRIGEVVEIGPQTRHDNPIALDATWRGLSRAVHRLGDQLAVEVDVDTMLGITPGPDTHKLGGRSS